MKVLNILWIWFLWAGLILSVHSFGQAPQWDQQCLRSIHTPHETKMDPFARGLSYSALPISASLPISQLLFDTAGTRNERLTRFLFFSGGLAAEAALNYGIKHTINRPRPFEQFADIQQKMEVSTFSFPSGHTGAAFYSATYLCLEYPRWYVIAPAALWAGGVGWSRLHLGVHYPTDVLAGMILGIGSAWVSHRIHRWLVQKNTIQGKKAKTL